MRLWSPPTLPSHSLLSFFFVESFFVYTWKTLCVREDYGRRNDFLSGQRNALPVMVEYEFFNVPSKSCLEQLPDADASGEHIGQARQRVPPTKTFASLCKRRRKRTEEDAELFGSWQCRVLVRCLRKRAHDRAGEGASYAAAQRGRGASAASPASRGRQRGAASGCA